MASHYDQFDYPQFWEGREYEHGSEVLAIKNFLNKIPHISRLLDLGGGYGRLSPYYIYRAKRVVIADPSARLLKLAKTKIKVMDQKRAGDIKYIHSRAQLIKKKVKNGSFDVVLIVRVLHLIQDSGEFFGVVNKLLKKNGYIIIEFPNKLNGKARAKSLIRRQHNVISFYPSDIENELENRGFTIVEKRSVSNIRSPFLKKHLPVSTLLFFEDLLQKPLAHLNFGPSIFILAKKRG